MPISLSHLGEVIVAEMAERERTAIVYALGLTESADLDHVRSVGTFAFHECKLGRHHGFIFDGASRIDVVLWIRPNLAVALELKLGTTRLTKTRIDDKFLRDCRLSHNDSRIAGNMMAILDRRFGVIAPADGLTVQLGETEVHLSRDWFVVTRQSVLDKWVGDDRPSFSPNTSIVTIGEFATAFGGQQPFNALVRELLNIDYFEKWVN
jgi:hypothetical protein